MNRSAEHAAALEKGCIKIQIGIEFSDRKAAEQRLLTGIQTGGNQEMKNIAIIEDDELLNEALSRMLTKAGYETLRAYTLREGISLVSRLPDLMIIDINLPDGEGTELCRKAREYSTIPVLFLTARDEEQDMIEAFDLGADDYMTKPFSPSELVARVKAHLARYERLIGTGVQENDIIEIRGLKIDKTARRVWVDGTEKAFTTKEFDLLTFLAQNPNHVFTKDELFKEIWDMESIGDIATVTVHIKKIREKIEKNSAKPQYIETIWGVGYRFKM